MAKSQEDGPASFIDNPYVKVMLLMGMPAVASVMQFASRKMMEQTDLNLAVAERVRRDARDFCASPTLTRFQAMQKVSQAAMPLQLVCGPITAAAKNVEPNTGDTTLLLTFGIFDLQTNQVRPIRGERSAICSLDRPLTGADVKCFLPSGDANRLSRVACARVLRTPV